MKELAKIGSDGSSEIETRRSYLFQKLYVNGSHLDQNGYLLADFIEYQGENPPLQKVNLKGCKILLQNLVKFMQFLSRCKHLTYLNLSENKLGESGHFLTESINYWDNKPPLKKLILYDSSLSTGICSELLQSLAKCKDITYLNLGKNCLDLFGCYLAESIKSWGNNPPLRKLALLDCSMPDDASMELAQCLITCKHLTHLDLSGNNLRGAGQELAHSVMSWGNDPPLQQLILHDCEMPEQTTGKLVQSLSICRSLTHLDLGGSDLCASGYDLAQSIRSWGSMPSLQQLLLYDCMMTENVSIELAESLATCRNLTHLQLGKNTLGEAGKTLAESIRSWGNDPVLNDLMLKDCEMSGNAFITLLQTLSICKSLTGLDLSDNNLCEAGHHLAQSIVSWGDNPPLQRIYLTHCLMPVGIWNELFQSLSVCGNLEEIDVSQEILDTAEYKIPVFVRSILSNQREQMVKFELVKESTIPKMLKGDDKEDGVENKDTKIIKMDSTEHEIRNEPSDQQPEREEIKEERMTEELEGKVLSIESKEQELLRQTIKHESPEQNRLYLQSLYTLASEYVRDEHVMDFRTNSKQLSFEAMMIKNNKEYHIAKILGKKVTVKKPLSEVSLEVAEGVQAIVMQSTNFNLDLLERVIQNECLASPVVQFHIKEQYQLMGGEEYKYKATIPHCLSRHHNLSCIRVRFGSLKRPLSMVEVQRGNPQNKAIPYFEINNRNITIFANHFCDVVCTSLQKICTSRILAIPNGWISTDESEFQTDMKVKTYLCSCLYSKIDMRKELEIDASKFGLQILEELTIPIDCHDDFDVEKTTVTVALTVTNDWLPTMDKDKKWKKKPKKMIEENKLPGVFNISNGHLCRSKPFDAANFAMTSQSGLRLFRGNIGVTFCIPEVPDQYRDITIRVPPPTEVTIPAVSSTATTVERTEETRTSGLEFTDAKLVKLSNKITKAKMLRTLAVIGLGMTTETVDSQLHNNDINDAAYEVLNEWKKNQTSKSEAYSNICEALRHGDVQLEFLIGEALK